MKRDIEKITAMILQLIEQDSELKEQFELLQSVPSIGKITAVTLLVDCPELGEISAVKVSALIALAHKILRIASALLKKKQMWYPNLTDTPT